MLKVEKHWPTTGVGKLSVKSQRVNILGFVSHEVSVVATQLGLYDKKVSIKKV